MTALPGRKKSSLRFQILFWSAIVIFFFYFLSLIHSILLPFVVGILASYFLDPAVNKLQTYKCSRSLAAAIITIIFFIIAILLCVTLVPLITHQLLNLIHDFPNYIDNLQTKYDTDLDDLMSRLSSGQTGAIKGAINNFSGTFAGWAGHIVSDILSSGRELLNLLSLIFITPIVVFYLLRDWDKLVVNFYNLLPRKYEHVISEQLQIIDRTLSGFIRGQTNVCLIMASYYSFMLTLVGLNFGIGLGIMTGVMLFVPFVGFATCFSLSMIVGLFQFGVQPHLIAVAGTYLVGMALEGSLLTPRLVGHEVGLHPVWIIFGMLSGGALFGLIGVLIAVPVTAVIGVFVRFALERYKQSTIYLAK